MKLRILFFLLLLYYLDSSAQHHQLVDSITFKQILDSVQITAHLNEGVIHKLPDVRGGYIFSGKKTEVIQITGGGADFSNKIARQLFAKIPGLFVYDMDGAGNQINIATRGLDPHRGWEFNIRKDGILTNSDMYGYPASHYNMPIESIERIELVRGTGSLQYGAQLGGMLNYVSKKGDSTKPIAFDIIHSIGSWNLKSGYYALGGRIGKLNYYGYFQKKHRNGYRDKEFTDAVAASFNLDYTPTEKLHLKLGWSRSMYLYRVPGALTDSQFYQNPQQHTRSRNYYSPDIHIPSFEINWHLNPRSLLLLSQSAVLGNRSSVLFDKATNIQDTINLLTNNYNHRQVDIDSYHSYTTELRWQQDYKVSDFAGNFILGVQYMNNDLHRLQLGKGTTGSDYTLVLVVPGWGRNLHLKTKNISLFFEQKLQLSNRLSLNGGFRWEKGNTRLSGTIYNYPDNAVPLSVVHDFPLFGASFSWMADNNSEVYGGIAQAFHPMYLKDLIPASSYEKVDPNIKDAKGVNAELGWRGHHKFIKWDISTFYLDYQNRFGAVAQTDLNGNAISYRTNIGDSRTLGVEALIQVDKNWGNRKSISFFTSSSIMDGRYKNASIKIGSQNISIKHHKVESVPTYITRNGASYRWRKWNTGFQYSFTSGTYADAMNTQQPVKSTGAIGWVPGYGLWDFNFGVRINQYLSMKGNINNLLNKQYFTKRPAFYPGPGIWPSDGRNWSMSLQMNF